MSVSRECCVFSGRGICDGLITPQKESSRLWFVWMWSRSLENEEDLAHYGLSHYRKNNSSDCTRDLNRTSSWNSSALQLETSFRRTLVTLITTICRNKYIVGFVTQFTVKSLKAVEKFMLSASSEIAYSLRVLISLTSFKNSASGWCNGRREWEEVGDINSSATSWFYSLYR